MIKIIKENILIALVMVVLIGGYFINNVNPIHRGITTVASFQVLAGKTAIKTAKISVYKIVNIPNI